MNGARADVLLADSVAVSDGRLHVQGGCWTHLLAADLPLLAGRLGVGIVLRLPAATTGDSVQVDLRVAGPDGCTLDLLTGDGARALTGLSAQVTLGALPGGSPLREHVVPLAINLDGVLIPRAGAYEVAVDVDGVPTGEASFAVLER